MFETLRKSGKLKGGKLPKRRLKRLLTEVSSDVVMTWYIRIVSRTH